MGGAKHLFTQSTQYDQAISKRLVSCGPFGKGFEGKSGAECQTGDAVRAFTLHTGGSLTIPCRYDTQYIQHKKYWCFSAGAAYNYCSILAHANETKGRVSVIDHPDQSLFTVTMTNLQDQDTGTYWCAVEIEGILNMDVTEQLYLSTIRSEIYCTHK
ncbi:Natural cytotoxicity triggering receptor 2 [Triplophysa tibetana]|uniref:Natural cytotoxicity triggering receptor 2 n=1 Tax=Triplophysa tibetana TaxID=1572043 RepID=A0A5A9PAM5_9TELE|nr:Natural cytotoxicity triggering receptor 2 [Triplophysa tibetana]